MIIEKVLEEKTELFTLVTVGGGGINKKLNKPQFFKSFHELKKQACVLLNHLSKSTAVSNACINEKGWSCE